MDAPNRKTEKTIITAISLVFLLWSAAFIFRSSFIAVDGQRYFCLFDDAMISMRYAWNFSHGSGLVWNPGQQIQGYTNLLMTLLMSVATLVFDKSAAVLFIQVSGAMFMLAIAFLTMKITDHIFQIKDPQRRLIFRILTFCCALYYYPLAYWSLMGMETGLLTVLILLGVQSAFNYAKTKNLTHLVWVSGFFGFAFLTRNDSLIFAGLVWIYLAWETLIPLSKDKLKDFWRLFMAFIYYLLFVTGQLVFQFSYYGEIMPNTYTLKLTGVPFSVRIMNGIGFITPFLVSSALVFILAILGLVFDFQKRKALLLSIALSAIAYQVYVGGDPWNYWRIVSPAMPLLTILFLWGSNTAALLITKAQASRGSQFRNPTIERSAFEILAASLVLLSLLIANASFLRQVIFLDKPYQTEINQENVNTAIALNQLTTGDATIGVYWAGSIPYFTDRETIDFLGKSDRYIAELPPDLSGSVAWNGMNSVPGHNKYDLNYSIKTLQPTYVQDFAWGSQDLTQWAEDKYISVEYNGLNLFLLLDSPAVLWHKINHQ